MRTPTLVLLSISLLALTLPSGVSASAQASPVGATPSQFPLQDAALVLHQVDRLWFFTGPNSGGYADVTSFLAPPSLYATAWNLRLVAAAHVMVPDLNPDQTAAWLTDVLAQPPRQEGSALQAMDLAAQALTALGRPIPPDPVRRALAPLRSGVGFADRPGQIWSWPATLAAVDLLQAAHLPVPGEITAALQADLSRTTVAPVLDQQRKLSGLLSQ